MSRWKAAAIHLLISALIGLVAAALIFGLWYPPPYSQAAGAGELVLLLLGVDIVLGPLLTLAVFRSGKKGMTFDLTVIAVLQACAFFYGASVVVRARPAFVVATVDRFVLVAANDLDSADVAKGSKPEFRSLPWLGPRVVGAELPTDTTSKVNLALSGMAGKDIDRFPQYYVDYTQVAAKLLSHAKPLATLRTMHQEAIPLINSWLNKHQRDASSVVTLPIVARSDAVMLLDKSTGEPLDALPISAW